MLRRRRSGQPVHVVRALRTGLLRTRRPLRGSIVTTADCIAGQCDSCDGSGRPCQTCRGSGSLCGRCKGGCLVHDLEEGVHCLMCGWRPTRCTTDLDLRELRRELETAADAERELRHAGRVSRPGSPILCLASDCQFWHMRRSFFCSGRCLARVRYREDPAFRHAKLKTNIVSSRAFRARARGIAA